jgi:hypothetical protein
MVYALMIMGAMAAAQAPQTTGTSQSQPAVTRAVEGGSAPAKDRRKYCVEILRTGSRIPHLDCRTRDQWIAQEEWDPVQK